MQICFNARKCLLLRRELPLFQRLLWATGYWVGFHLLAAGQTTGVMSWTTVCRLQRSFCGCVQSSLTCHTGSSC